MFLKKIPKEFTANLSDSFILPVGFHAYFKMIDDNTIATDSNGDILAVAMTKEEVNEALKNGEFTKIED